jgi:drug/metabolite transporter (DMT)-like permease
MFMSPARKAVLALIAANLIWGAASPIFKLSLENIPPLTLAFWRFFLGSAILMMVFGPRLFRTGRLFDDHKKELIMYALSGITFNIIFFFLGLQLTLSINAPVIAASAPIITAISAFIILKERISGRKIIGVITGFAGIIIIVIEPLLLTGLDGSVMGNLFLIIATLGAVGQTIIGRKILPKYDPLMITFWAFVIGSATFAPFAASEAARYPDLYAVLDWRGYTGIIFGSIFSSVCGYALYAWALSKIKATDATMFAYIDPVIGTVLGFFLLHEPITIPFIVGSFLIFGGILIAEGRIVHYPIRRLLGKE